MAVSMSTLVLGCIGTRDGNTGRKWSWQGGIQKPSIGHRFAAAVDQTLQTQLHALQISLRNNWDALLIFWGEGQLQNCLPATLQRS